MHSVKHVTFSIPYFRVSSHIPIPYERCRQMLKWIRLRDFLMYILKVTCCTIAACLWCPFCILLAQTCQQLNTESERIYLIELHQSCVQNFFMLVDVACNTKFCVSF